MAFKKILVEGDPIPTSSLPEALIVPTGSIQMFAGATAPTGWLMCDGAQISREVYSNLYAVIGTTYGNGDGSTTFNVPNMLGRSPFGYDPMQFEFDSLGKTSGEKAHTLAVSEMPAHVHLVSPPETTSSGISETHVHHIAPPSIQTGEDWPDHTHTERSTLTDDTSTMAAKPIGSTNDDIPAPTTVSTDGASNRHTHSVSFEMFDSSEESNNHTHNVAFDPFNSETAGEGIAHNNLPPTFAINFIIKA